MFALFAVSYRENHWIYQVGLMRVGYSLQSQILLGNPFAVYNINYNFSLFGVFDSSLRQAGCYLPRVDA
jgi:hypothetical protein